MSKLTLITFHYDDELRGNFELLRSGPVKHIPNPHRWLVSEEQRQMLDELGLRYSEFKEDDQGSGEKTT